MDATCWASSMPRESRVCWSLRRHPPPRERRPPPGQPPAPGGKAPPGNAAGGIAVAAVRSEARGLRAAGCRCSRAVGSSPENWLGGPGSGQKLRRARGELIKARTGPDAAQPPLLDGGVERPLGAMCCCRHSPALSVSFYCIPCCVMQSQRYGRNAQTVRHVQQGSGQGAAACQRHVAFPSRRGFREWREGVQSLTNAAKKVQN